MKHKVEIINYDIFEKEFKKYIKNKNEITEIQKAFNFANEKHEGIKRNTGEDFINHPLTVAKILTKMKVDYETLILALIHDITEEYENEIKDIFNDNIYNLFKEYKKIDEINLSTKSESVCENYKKILVGICNDVRVIFVKLSDRLHNMRTMWVMPEKMQKEKAKENLEILTPIAHRLGIHKIKSELEDLSLRYLKPDIYYGIVEELNSTKIERDKKVNEMIEEVSNILNKENIKHKIKGRSKSIYSIYNKMSHGKKFNDIYDLFALRIIVNTKEECYSSIGYLHSKFKPMPKRFKDYIAMPKSNLYQSLHSTVFGKNGLIFEIQIRTKKMDEIAEYGIASHWSYKEGNSSKNIMEQKLEIFREVVDNSNNDLNNEEFVNYVKEEVLDQNIYVYTPNGDIIELTKGATPIDFAYKVHTGVGNKMIGAIVNNNIVSLDYELKNNDIIKINTNKNSKGPNKEWLKIAKSSQAKNKIKSFFSKKDKIEYIKIGEEKLLKKLRRKKIVQSDFLKDENKQKIFKEFKLCNEEDLYFNIGNNRITPTSLINYIYNKHLSKNELISKKMLNNKNKKIKYNKDIIVEGINDIKVTLASCCKPIPGDNIIGYISKGKGITVHRKCCHNILDENERIVDVTWNKLDKKYLTTIIIHSNTNENILLDLIAKTKNTNVTIEEMKTINKNKNLIYEMLILTKNNEELQNFINEINKLNKIKEVKRLIK